MIKKMIITNYRSHQATELDFHPNVNVIVGRGQAGKSNIMRAFDTARTNRPMGFRYHSWFAGDEDTTITVFADDDQILTFAKNKDGAHYLVNGHPMRKIGTKVPEEVSRLLNMVDLNMQWQHDSPYLITGSVGQIGKAINAVIDFEEIDQWLSELRSRKAKVGQSKKTITQLLTDAQGELATMPNTKAAGDLIAAAELLEEKIRRDKSYHAKLAYLIQDIQTHSHELEAITPMLAAEGLMQRAEHHQAQIDQWERERVWLSDGLTISAQLSGAEDEVKFAETRLWEAVLQMGQCPTCGQDIDKQHLDHILEAL